MNLPPILSRLPSIAIDRLDPDTLGRLEALHRAGFLEPALAQVPPDAPPETWETLIGDLASCDLDWISGLRQALQSPPARWNPGDLQPVAALSLEDPRRDSWRDLGMQVLAQGGVASLVFAGGAATRFFSEAAGDPEVEALRDRLGTHPPKGLYPLYPVLRRNFLEVFLAEALEAGLAVGRLPPVVWMTSRQTDRAIRRWLEEDYRESFPRDLVRLIPQQEHPRLDPQGRLVVDPEGHLVRTGDGHGGVFRALCRTDDGPAPRDLLRQQGIRTLVMHNVDNARSRPFEPSRLGVHGSFGFAFTMTVAPRAHVREKVGLVVRHAGTGRIEVIEYSVCPPEVADARDPDGRPRFRLGHLNTNLVDLAAIRPDLPRTLYTGKKVAVGDRQVETASHEMLNQHLSGLLPPDRVGVLEVPREDFFLPTKSLRGEDSLARTREALVQGHRDRLRDAGAQVDPSAWIELHPCLAEGPWPLGTLRDWEVGPGSTLALAAVHGPSGAPPLGAGLRLGEGATLVVDADRPRGPLAMDPETRQVREDPAEAGHLALGRGVVVAPGARIRVRIRGDGCLVIPDGALLSGEADLVVPEGETRIWSSGIE